jgi:selT/selW/selH-like putative selenoprotein
LRKEFKVEAELKAGGGGILDVTVDGELIFSKLNEGDRFPEPGEVEARIKERLV